MTRRQHRATLRGWVRWLPFLIIPFSIFFFETWLRTETIMMGYRANELNVEIRQVRERVNVLENQAADLERMERINRKARDYGLVEPKPNETEVIVKWLKPPSRVVEPRGEGGLSVAGIFGIGAGEVRRDGE